MPKKFPRPLWITVVTPYAASKNLIVITTKGNFSRPKDHHYLSWQW